MRARVHQGNCWSLLCIVEVTRFGIDEGGRIRGSEGKRIRDNLDFWLEQLTG